MPDLQGVLAGYRQQNTVYFDLNFALISALANGTSQAEISSRCPSCLMSRGGVRRSPQPLSIRIISYYDNGCFQRFCSNNSSEMKNKVQIAGDKISMKLEMHGIFSAFNLSCPRLEFFCYLHHFAFWEGKVPPNFFVFRKN